MVGIERYLKPLVAVLLIMVATGCSVFQQGGQQGDEGGGESRETLAINLQTEISDLDSTTTTDVYSFDVLNNIMEGLYRRDENEEPQPAMAEGVEISDDRLTYTFTLRDGMEWSNGDPVTSHDFEYAWLKAMDPKTASQYSFIVADFIEGGSEFAAGEADAEDVAIETPDDKTLEVRLARPTPFFLSLTSFTTYLPQNEEFVERQGERYAQNAEALLYNGPYTLSEFNPTEGATFAKNENYWDKENVDIERVEGRIVKDIATAVNLYQTGELDVVDLTSEYVDEYRDSPEFATRTQFATSYLGMNQEDPVFGNENIRKAVQAGFDRQALADEILNNGSVAADGLVPVGVAGPGDQTFREAQGPTVPAYDPEQARELYQRGVDELGQEPTIELLTDDSGPSQDLAVFIQAQLEENLGANVEVKVQPFDRMYQLQTAGDYQMVGLGWGADYNDPMSFLDLFVSGSPLNTVFFENERYDQLVNGAKAEADSARRMDMLLEAERVLIEDEAAIAPMLFLGKAQLVQPHLKNYYEHPYGASHDFKDLEIEH